VSRLGRIKERDLDGHLENENLPDQETSAPAIGRLLENDYQLNEAFNLLNGMILYSKLNAAGKADE
jgi:hypothetical protein